MAMTRKKKKHIRIQNNKIRRYCRWKKISVEEYWLRKSGLYHLAEQISQFGTSFREFASSISKSMGNLFIGYGNYLLGVGERLDEES